MKLRFTILSGIALLGYANAGEQGNNQAAKAGKPSVKAMRTTYDASLPKLTPWVLFIHGGGWSAGSKEVVSGTVNVSQLRVTDYLLDVLKSGNQSSAHRN